MAHPLLASLTFDTLLAPLALDSGKVVIWRASVGKPLTAVEVYLEPSILNPDLYLKPSTLNPDLYLNPD